MRPIDPRAVAAVGLAVLTGCTSSAPSPSAATPAPTSAPASTPTSTPEPPPSRAPTATAAPSAPPPPTASADAVAARFCGDAYVLEQLSRSPVGWEGSFEERLAQAQPRGVFEPGGAIDGLDAVCVVTYRMRAAGGHGTVVVSEAVLERDDEVFASLDAWSSAHLYELRTRETGFVEREAPPDADGSPTMVLVWAPLDGDDPVVGNAAELQLLTGAPPDAVLVIHSDFTRG